MSSFRYGSYNPKLELLKLSIAEDKFRFTLAKDENEIYELDEKFSKELTIKAFRVSENLPTLGAKAGDIVLIDKNVKKYIKSNMDEKKMCMFTNNAPDVFDSRYWFGYANQVFDGSGIARGKCFYFHMPKGGMKLCRFKTLNEYLYGVVIQIIEYFI